MRSHIIALTVIALASAQARAWPRLAVEDDVLVARSELVVVAHVVPGSIAEVDVDGFATFHATLAIQRVIKGKATTTELPIVIHHGLTPQVDPTGTMQIVDTGGACCATVVDDVSRDALWFLRRLAAPHGEPASGGSFGVVDPQDVEPVSDRDYFAIYLSRSPVTAASAFAAAHNDTRAKAFVERAAIRAAAKLSDPAKRVATLLPYFMNRGGSSEVVDAMASAGGDVAGPRLLAIFATADRATRLSIFEVWQRTRYRGAVAPLIALLGEEDAYWAAQTLQTGWWNPSSSDALTDDRRAHYGEVMEAVFTLGKIGNAVAKSTIEATRARWVTLPDNQQIVGTCDEAIRALTP